MEDGVQVNVIATDREHRAFLKIGAKDGGLTEIENNLGGVVTFSFSNDE